MVCPICHKKMTQEDFGGVAIDVCEDGCKGLWFDHVELAKLDEKNEGVGQALQNALASDRHKDNNRGRIKCPKCNTLMVAHFYQSDTLVTIDECYQCGGFYLDSGELEVIRDNHLNDEQREKFIRDLLAKKSEYVAAQNKLASDQKKINRGTVAREESVYKFANMLMEHFKD